jgi:Amt family ammonium transporter
MASANISASLPVATSAVPTATAAAVTLLYNSASTSAWGTYDPGDTAWILTSTALVWVMIPGVGYYYSGMARSKNALSLIMLSLLSAAVVSVQWFMFGYSLAFSTTGSSFIGNFQNAFFRGVLGGPSVGNAKVPDLVFAIYQCMFAAITPALAIGSAAERGRLVPMTIFLFVWTTLVYDFIAYWTWSIGGWSFKLGTLDFAGGSPVHISSGAASLAYALILGKRHGHGVEEFKPHNISNVVLGTVFLWFGWFGFNGGSNAASNLRAAMACVVTNLSASVAALTWMIMDYRYERKLSAMGFCSGAVAGLVAITPASGLVGPAGAVAIGFLGAVGCNFACKLKHAFDYDDALDVFAVHGVGGFIGCILTGIFSEGYISGLDGAAPLPGGWLNQYWIQVGYQLADATSAMTWSFVVTYIILFIMNKIPGLSLRASEEQEKAGMDHSDLGELAYYFYDKDEFKAYQKELKVQGNEKLPGTV